MIKPTRKAEQHIKNILAADDIFEKGLRNALFEIGKDAARAAAALINNNGRSGRLYFYGGKPHRASAPGEPPANRTGRLKKSMDYSVHGDYQVEFGSTASYAKDLEEGSDKIEPRPFLKEVVESKGAQHAETLGAEVTDEIKRRS